MLRSKNIREKPEKIQNMLKARAVDFDLDGLIEADQKRREYIIKTDELRKKEKSSCITNFRKKESRRRCITILDRDEKRFSRTRKLESQQEELRKNMLD